MTDSEKLLHEIEVLIKPILIKGEGIDYGSDNTPIKAVEIQKCEMLTIQNYRGHQIKLIIKKL